MCNMYKAPILCSSPRNQAKGKPLIPEYIMCSIEHGHLPAIFVALIYNPPGVYLTENSDVIDNLTTYSTEFEHRIVILQTLCS